MCFYVCVTLQPEGNERKKERTKERRGSFSTTGKNKLTPRDPSHRRVRACTSALRGVRDQSGQYIISGCRVGERDGAGDVVDNILVKWTPIGVVSGVLSLCGLFPRRRSVGL